MSPVFPPVSFWSTPDTRCVHEGLCYVTSRGRLHTLDFNGAVPYLLTQMAYMPQNSAQLWVPGKWSVKAPGGTLWGTHQRPAISAPTALSPPQDMESSSPQTWVCVLVALQEQCPQNSLTQRERKPKKPDWKTGQILVARRVVWRAPLRLVGSFQHFLLKYSSGTILHVTGVQYSDSQFFIGYTPLKVL